MLFNSCIVSLNIENHETIRNTNIFSSQNKRYSVQNDEAFHFPTIYLFFKKYEVLHAASKHLAMSNTFYKYLAKMIIIMINTVENN